MLSEIFLDIDREIIDAEFTFEFLNCFNQPFVGEKTELFPRAPVESLRLRAAAAAFISEENNTGTFQLHELAQLFHDPAGEFDHPEFRPHHLRQLGCRTPVIVPRAVVHPVNDLLAFPSDKPYHQRERTGDRHQHGFLKRFLLTRQCRRAEDFNGRAGKPDIGQMQFCLRKSEKNFQSNGCQNKYPHP